MDPTVALTGLLPAVIAIGALLAFPASLLFLRLYRASVVKTMAKHASAAPALSWPVGDPQGAPGQAARVVRATIVGRTHLPASAGSRGAPRRPWRAAGVYAAAGAGYAAAMTACWLLATRDREISWIKLVFLFWTYLWPLTITILLIVVADQRTALKVYATYFVVWLAGFALFATVAVARSPKLAPGDLPLFWLLQNGPPSLLVAAFLARPFRAAGPIVLPLLVIAAAGSQALPLLAAASPTVLRRIATVGFALGLSGAGVFWGMMVAGLMAFGALGWGFLRWIGRRYKVKKLSEQSLTVDSVWLLFGILQSIELTFEGPPWILSGLAAFSAYKLVASRGFRLLASRSPPLQQRKLLMLRVFALGKRSEKLFRAVRKLWLRTGTISLIAGPDLATATVEPHEFLAFLGGGLRGRFVTGAADLDRRLPGLDLPPNPDGAYEVSDFFCFADTWQMTMRRLATCSDAVLMDLRGFSHNNHGCLYELGELLKGVDLEKVIFVVDDRTDRAYLDATLERLSSTITPESPNWSAADPRARLFPMRSQSGAQLSALFGLLVGADRRSAVGGERAASASG